jgi:hypothetical protein
MRAMMSTPPVLGTPVEAQPIMARMAELEAARILRQTEPLGRQMKDGSFSRGAAAIPFAPAREVLADSLRAFDAMTIDDLAALQTVR